MQARWQGFKGEVCVDQAMGNQAQGPRVFAVSVGQTQVYLTPSATVTPVYVGSTMLRDSNVYYCRQYNYDKALLQLFINCDLIKSIYKLEIYLKRENNGFQAKENDYWIKSEILNQFRRSTIQFMFFFNS